MRKFFITLLMASAIMPATAMAKDRDWSGDRRVERSEQREQRREKATPTVQVQRSLPSQASDTARERSFGQRGDAMRSDRAFEVRERRHGDDNRRAVSRRAPVPNLDQLRDRRSSDDLERRVDRRPATAKINERRDRGGFGRLGDRVIRDGDRVEHRRDRHGDWHRDHRDFHRDWQRDHRAWHRDWRNDHRYDWRRHRDRNRWVFRFGNYYDPYRYGYRRFNIGYNLWPNYYSSRHWLNDPWEYRLPPAYGPYRWVRYYDDALLVNIYTGQVVDVIYSVFW